MKTKWSMYKELELIPDSVEDPNYERLTIPESLKTWLENAWNHAITFLAGGSEIRVWMKINASGEVWYVYDPTTNRTHCFLSEAEVRVWLEETFYSGR